MFKKLISWIRNCTYTSCYRDRRDCGVAYHGMCCGSKGDVQCLKCPYLITRKYY